MNRIDMLVERYAMGFKRLGVVNDVFVNPTKSELMELGGMFRFIADAKHKKLYVFGHNLFHADVWMKKNESKMKKVVAKWSDYE